MKRKIAIVLVGIMCISASGCSFMKKSTVDVNTVSAEDIFTEISDDSAVEASEVAETFTNAMSAVDSAENITINVDNRIVMGDKEGKDYQSSISRSEIKKAKDGDNQIGNVDIKNSLEYTESDETTGESTGKVQKEENNISGYYSGDALYFITNEGDKVVEEMTYDDFLSVVNTYGLSLFEDCISKAAAVEDKDGKTYYISYDPSKFETTMNTNMEASGQTMADGEAMKVNYANIAAKVDGEGNLMGYAFAIDAEYVNDQGSTPYNYSITADFSDLGSTKVKAVKNTDDYMTAEEYTQKMQNEANSGSESESAEESSEAETAAEEESGN